MAKEKIIEIKTGPAIKSIQDLRDNITEYKKVLSSLEIGTKEYQETLTSLQQNQAALRNAMYGTTASMEQVRKAAIGLTSDFRDMDAVIADTTAKLKDESTSYNEYVRILAQLKEAWRSTTDAGDRAKLGEAIDAVNDRLKDLDKSVGTFGRNVGNYIGAVDHLTAGLSGMGSGAQKIIAPLKGVNAGLKTMSATPATAILGVLATILDKIISEMKGTEESANKVTAAMAPFAAVGDLVTKAMQGLGKALSSVFGWFSQLLQNIFPKLREQAELRAEITEQEIALSYKQREAVQANADAELKVAKLRNEAADKTNKTAKERIALLKQAQAIELQISKRSVDIATKEYEIAVLRAKTTENSKEQNDALAAAYANKVKAETDYYNSTMNLKRQIAAAEKEEEQAAERAVIEERRARQRMIQINKQYWETRLQTAIKGSEDEYTTRAAILEDEYLLEKERAMTDIKDADEKVKTLENIERIFNLKRLQLAEEFADAQVAEERLAFENRMNTLRQGSLEYLAAAVELKKFELDTLHQLETESNEQFRAREIAAEKAYSDAKEALWKSNLSIMQQAAGGISSILGSIADAYENNTNATREEAEKAKNLRIAGATIDMLSGAVTAYSSAQSLGVPMGPIIGALNAAAVVAAGLVNIAKIRSTQISTSSGNSATPTVPATVNAPAVTPEVNRVRTVTSATEEDRLNRMAAEQRVYILESDIEASENQRRVEVAETTF